MKLLFRMLQNKSHEVLLLVFLAGMPAFSASLVVTSLADSGPGTLRDAIAAASPGDSISFSVTGTVTLSSTLAIGKSITINGPGASSLAISGNNSVAVLFVNPGLSVNLSGVTIENGHISCIGTAAGISNYGALTLAESVVSGNSGCIYGGILNVVGTLTVKNSIISGNTGSNAGGIFNNSGTVLMTNSVVSGNAGGAANSVGGGISNVNNGVMSLTNVTVSNNSASSNGGGFFNGATLTLINSTVSGNSATQGGGFYNYGPLKLTNSTVSANSANNGGGFVNDVGGTLMLTNTTVSGNSASLHGGAIFTYAGTPALKNTLLSNNSAGGNCYLYTFPSVVSYGFNLSDDNSCALNDVGDRNNVPAGLDPDGLRDNGGPTKTIALLATSPAVDAIPASSPNYCTAMDGVTPLAADQRGVSRPVGTACDIGAFEFTPPLDTIGPGTSNVLITPNPLAVNTSSDLVATVSDALMGGSIVTSARYTINGGSPIQMSLNPRAAVTTQASAVLAPFTADEVYNVCVLGVDSAGNAGPSSCVLLPVYDPAAGFVSGGGTLTSPPGADLLNTGAAGPATFGFVAKYLAGKNTPSGNLEFQFNEGNLNFKSTSMDWLVVTGQPRARFHGMGTVNGTNVCYFEVDAWAGSAQPGNLDALGLKITGCAGGGDRYVLPPTALDKGSIIIHK